MKVARLTELEWLKQTIQDKPKVKKDKQKVEELFSEILEQEKQKLKE